PTPSPIARAGLRSRPSRAPLAPAPLNCPCPYCRWRAARQKSAAPELDFIPKKQSAGLIAQNAGGCFLLTRLPRLRLYDSRRDEEDQLLVRAVHRLVFEQVAQPRNASEQGHLLVVDGIAGLDHAADDHGSAIGDQHLRCRLLGHQGGVAIDLAPKVRSRVLHIYVEENGVLNRDLRSNGQTQERVDIGGRGGTV